ncbi:MAG: BtrH N-terminal domain-containing protein [Proteobacteria bacterium]|nr:BtrH N-terminal domain-containing protein [Pseudomonadota bacterium]MBU4296425.1 BtrH N-terminal domain-containing protein [Pseudomonadota bacterium]MCG2748694.1 BtrH N-terminal domain-containing protein [Desulfobulbaceae bacterium]
MPNFPHHQSAHCESGVAANLLSYQGINISEAMAFGIGGGLFFGYLPFIRINGMPLVTYRAAPGHILRQIASIPGVRMHQKKFRRQDEAMAELDRALASSMPVGLQTGVFWLPYFPKALRFHFNAHNLVVYGKVGNEYLISDPVFPQPVRCPAEDLARARFASGALAPKGKMYYFDQLPARLERGPLILRGIQTVCRMMLGSPFPLIGVRGIRFLAKRLGKWPQRLGRESADLHLGHVVRMQEEIGTGGGGFRFMYAAFLQESAEIMQESLLRDCSASLTTAGDTWREFAAMAARVCKGRARPDDTYSAMAGCIDRCADLEKKVFTELQQWVKGRS